MIELKPESFDFAEAASLAVAVCGRQLIADNSGALYWPKHNTLLVADLHLARRADAPGAGQPSGARRTLIKLAEVIDRYDPTRVIAMEDGPDERAAAAGMAAEDLEVLRLLQEDRDWIWLAGRADADLALQLGGRTLGQLQLSGLALRHRPSPGWATHEICAHMRPAARVCMYGYSLRRACFVGNGRRLVMPAFAASSGGLNVLDDAFRRLFGNGGMAVWMLGREGLYPVAPRLLAGD